MPATERRAEARWIPARERWQINVQRDGVRKTFTSKIKGKKGKHDAEVKADKWLISRETPQRFLVAWERFSANRDESVSRVSRRAENSCARTWILPNIANRPLSRITAADWQACIDKAAAKGRSKNTMLHIVALITCFLSFCRKNRWEINPLAPGELELPKTDDTRPRQALQPSEIRTLFSTDAVGSQSAPKKAWYVNAWRLCVLTGLRPSEIAGLDVNDHEGRALYVRRSINALGESRGGKTANARRIVALTPAAQAVLAAQAAMLKEKGIKSAWLFPTADGAHTDAKKLACGWRAYCKRHQITVTLYELRHTFVSIAKADLPLALLKQQVGHSQSMNTLDVYAHRMNGDDAKTVQILDALQSEILTPPAV